MIANLGKLLPYHRLDDLIVRARLRVRHIRLRSEFLVLDVQRQCAVFENRASFQHYVISKLFRGADSDFNSPVGRAQIVTGLSDRTFDRKSDTQEYEQYRSQGPHPNHLLGSAVLC